MGLTAERHANTPQTAGAPGRRRRQTRSARPAEAPPGTPEEAWAVLDAEADAKALVSLSEFLAKRGLRTRGSACQDAMDAIARLQDEMRHLTTGPQQG